MKPGIKTTEFWLALLIVGGIFTLVWYGKFPGHGEPGYEGMEYILVVWGAFTGQRTLLKRGNAVEDVETKEKANETKPVPPDMPSVH